MLGLMARGQTNEAIARNLHRSVSTVKKHVRHILAKLGVSGRAQAVMKAHELDLLPERKRE